VFVKEMLVELRGKSGRQWGLVMICVEDVGGSSVYRMYISGLLAEVMRM